MLRSVYLVRSCICKCFITITLSLGWPSNLAFNCSRSWRNSLREWRISWHAYSPWRISYETSKIWDVDGIYSFILLTYIGKRKIPFKYTYLPNHNWLPPWKLATCHYKYYFDLIYYILFIIYIYYVIVEDVVIMIQSIFEDTDSSGIGFISPRLSDEEIRRIAANVLSFLLNFTFSLWIIAVLNVERLLISLLLIPSNFVVSHLLSVILSLSSLFVQYYYYFSLEFKQYSIYNSNEFRYENYYAKSHLDPKISIQYWKFT